MKDEIETNPFYTQTQGFRKPSYKGFKSTSFFITTRDGVKLAADVLLPKGLPPDEKIPTILIQTRYWRSMEARAPFKWFLNLATNPLLCKNMVKYGYALVSLDVRGTGASFGTREHPVGVEEVRDGADIVDWIIKQPWSNGIVVTWGNSYTGMTSELTLSLNHPAIKCGIVKHNPWDFYCDIFAGGCYNKGYTSYWSRLGRGLDQTKGKALKVFKPLKRLFGTLVPLIVKGVRPVKSSEGNLSEVAEIHSVNKYLEDYGEKVTFRDDAINEEGLTIDDLSIFSYQRKIEKLNVPMYCWGSWMDSCSANTVISRFLTYSNPQICVIGDWDHPGHHRASPYFSHKRKPIIPKKGQVEEWVGFYDDCLNGNFSTGENILYYYTMGEERWKKTTRWPPKSQKLINAYLAENHTLSFSKPTSDVGKDEYLINFDVTTGLRNRWYTMIGGPVHYYNRKEEDQKLLTYTSGPLDEKMEITGHPIVTLFLSSTHEDGMVCVYLEFIDEKEEIHWITDGQLRFMHRRISSETPPYQFPSVYHSYKKQDVQKFLPNEITEIKFALYPTSIQLRRGHKIRVAISGADKDSFERYPNEGTPKITVERNREFASFIELPIIRE